MELATAQEKMIEIYHQQPQELLDRDKYYRAVTEFREIFNLKEPYSSYNSFKNAQTKSHNSRGKSTK